MKFSMKFALAAALQIALLVGMIGFKYKSLATGTEIILEVPVPIDPRSLFRGDYVIIRYAINNIDTGKIAGDLRGPVVGMPVFLVLEPNNDEIWKPVAVYSEKPSGEGLFIKGRIKSVDNYGWNKDKLQVNYGIEQYFVPEGTGRDMEKRLREVKKAVVSVDPEGRASIIRIPEE